MSTENKQFCYFEVAEGGMTQHRMHAGNISDVLKCLDGWMSPSCIDRDNKLLKWTESAEVGEEFNHRLGIMVRVKDKELNLVGLANQEFNKLLRSRANDLKVGKNNDLFSHVVDVEHGDGSTMHFKYASAKVNGRYLLVFSEHNGAYGFHLEDLAGWGQSKSI